MFKQAWTQANAGFTGSVGKRPPLRSITGSTISLAEPEVVAMSDDPAASVEFRYATPGQEFGVRASALPDVYAHAPAADRTTLFRRLRHRQLCARSVSH